MSWLELPEDDQPSQEIWLDGEAITVHFERVRDKYRSESSGDTIGDPSTWGDNELTRGLRE